jgi:hypothetical protein
MADEAILGLIKTHAELLVPMTANAVAKARAELEKWEVSRVLVPQWWWVDSYPACQSWGGPNLGTIFGAENGT